MPCDLNPHWLCEVGATPPASGFRVYAVAYPAATGRRVRVWNHRTAKAAFRRLGSVTGGNLRMKDDHAAFAMDPAGRCYSWRDLKAQIKESNT